MHNQPFLCTEHSVFFLMIQIHKFDIAIGIVSRELKTINASHLQHANQYITEYTTFTL